MRLQSGVPLAELFEEQWLNAALSWTLDIVLMGFGIWELARGEARWGILVLFIALLAMVPGTFYKSVITTLPWEINALVTAAVGWQFFAPESGIARNAVIASGALLIVTELNLFTTTRMNHRFVVVLVAISTAAIAGAWALLGWASDTYLATNYIISNEELMGDFIAAAFVGVVAGILFDLYVRIWEARMDRLTPLLASKSE